MSISDAVDLLAPSAVMLVGLTAVLGLIIGSFLNVVILRLPRMMALEWERECAEIGAEGGDMAAPVPPEEAPEAHPLSLSHPPSTCPHCGARIAPWDNVPVVSWLLLRGRCRSCKGTISVRYPLIEALTAVLSVIVVWHFGASPEAAAALVLTWGLITLAVIDLDTQLLPDDITQPLLWLGLVLSLFGLFTDSTSAIIGAVSGFMALWLVYHAFRLMTGKEGMGRGDFKLLALFGAWLGWQTLPQIILLAALSGAVIGVGLIAAGRRDASQPMPFGPYLAVAGWIAMMWGTSITDAYLRWSGLAA